MLSSCQLSSLCLIVPFACSSFCLFLSRNINCISVSFLVILYLDPSPSVVAACFLWFPVRQVFEHTMFLCGILSSLQFVSNSTVSTWELQCSECSAPSLGHIMHRQMLSKISLAMHIWHFYTQSSLFSPSCEGHLSCHLTHYQHLSLVPRTKDKDLLLSH